jgi:hypothetical protein
MSGAFQKARSTFSITTAIQSCYVLHIERHFCFLASGSLVDPFHDTTDSTTRIFHILFPARSQRCFSNYHTFFPLRQHDRSSIDWAASAGELAVNARTNCSQP